MKTSELTPVSVKAMPLSEFEQRFGFRPVDALEKWGWAMQGIKIDSMTRQMMAAGVIDMPDLSGIVMT